MPKKPMTIRKGHELRGGRDCPPRSRTIMSSSATPRANRVKMSVGGEISRSAALVATNEMPEKITAARAARRGGRSGFNGLDRSRSLVLDYFANSRILLIGRIDAS